MPDLEPGVVSASLRAEAVEVLQRTVAQESLWVKVHAAEGLIWGGEAGNIADVFEAELGTDQPAYRVGVLRVLIQAADGRTEAVQAYYERLLEIFHDEDATDRLNAIETLAKLGYAERTEQVLAAAEPDAGRMQVYARWVLSNTGTAIDEGPLAELVGGEDAAFRSGAAYALRHREHLSKATVAVIGSALAAHRHERPRDVYLHSAWYVHCPRQRRPLARRMLLELLSSDAASDRNEVCLALARRGAGRDVPILVGLMRHDPSADVRAYAAFALLNMDNRSQGW